MPVPGSRLGVPGGLAGAGPACGARAVESKSDAIRWSRALDPGSQTQLRSVNCKPTSLQP